MFLRRMETNWKKHRKQTMAILAFAVFRIVLEIGFGWAPLNWLACLGLALGFAAATVVWAFLRTLWEMATAWHKRTCTFVVALRKFCRDYWSKTAAA